MEPNGQLRGHPIYWDGQDWRYCDNHEPTESTWRDRPCGHCGLRETAEGHDACLGTLPGVRNACCGHGDVSEAYIQWPDGSDIRGLWALERMGQLIALRDAGEQRTYTDAQGSRWILGSDGMWHGACRMVWGQ